MRRLLGSAIAAVLCIGLLSSCALFGDPDPSKTQANVEMQHIEAAIKQHDAAALKALFSNAAQARGTNLDGGIVDLLSLFPSGFKNLGEPAGGPGESDDSANGRVLVELFGGYKVSANGKKYEVYFAYFPASQGVNPDDVGLYALGVEPWNADSFKHPTSTSKAFNAWTSQFDIGEDHEATGTPGVYVYSSHQ